MFYATKTPAEHLGGMTQTLLRIEIIISGKPRWFYPTEVDTLEQASRIADHLNARGILSTRDALIELRNTDVEF